MIYLLCLHVSYFFIWAAQPVFTWCNTTAGRCWDCSSPVKCTQQLCLVYNSHYHSKYEITFPLAIVFSVQWNFGHSILRHLCSTELCWIEIFHSKGKIFTHISLPVINLKHSHWQLFWQPNAWRWGQLAFALLCGTPHFMRNLHTARQCRRRNLNALINYIMKSHAAELESRLAARMLTEQMHIPTYTTMCGRIINDAVLVHTVKLDISATLKAKSFL